MRAQLDFEAIFDASPNPYMVLDRDLRYVAANQAYLEITTRRREDLIGERLWGPGGHPGLGEARDEGREQLSALADRVSRGRIRQPR